MSVTVDSGLATGKSETTALYAKGVGLIENVTKMKDGKKTSTQTLRLTKLEGAKSTE